jgi:hypothetical protein
MTAKWAIYKKKQLEGLISDLERDVQRLLMYHQVDSMRLQMDEVEELETPLLLEMQSIAAEEEDTAMEAIIKDEIGVRMSQGVHSFTGTFTTCSGQTGAVHIGDHVTRGAAAIGQGHRYSGVFKGNGPGKIRLGNIHR